MYRAPAAAFEASPAAMRLKLRAHAQGGLSVDIIKCRGGRAGMSVQLSPTVGASLTSHR
jgi:hypothetical protein